MALIRITDMTIKNSWTLFIIFLSFFALTMLRIWITVGPLVRYDSIYVEGDLNPPPRSKQKSSLSIQNKPKKQGSRAKFCWKSKQILMETSYGQRSSISNPLLKMDLGFGICTLQQGRPSHSGHLNPTTIEAAFGRLCLPSLSILSRK